MKPAIDSDEFLGELGGWAIRGTCCALLSGFWAVMMGFQHPAEIAGLVFGLALWIALLAAGCVWLPLPAAISRPQAIRALKVAAWIKFGFAVLGILAAVGTSNFCGPLRAFGMLGLVDMVFGLAALWSVGQLAGVSDIKHLSTFDSFGWTALTTVIDGALVALSIGAIAVAVLVWRRIAPKIAAWLNLPPARVAG
jgi:hypothetical protein